MFSQVNCIEGRCCSSSSRAQFAVCFAFIAIINHKIPEMIAVISGVSRGLSIIAESYECTELQTVFEYRDEISASYKDSFHS